MFKKIIEKFIGLFGKNHNARRTVYIERKPVGIDPKRVEVIIVPDGSKDGLIILRRGVEDIRLGDANYATICIAIDGEPCFIKGFASYGNDNEFSEGKDVIVYSHDFNVLRPMRRTKSGDVDWNNPFDYIIKHNGQTGVVNKISEEGDWATWSKQPVKIFKKIK